MPHYEYDFENIANNTHLVPFSTYYKIKDFDADIDEYNNFMIEYAQDFEDKCISKTQMLLDNITGDIIGYFSLCSASIKLTNDERTECGMSDITFNSIPALKIGKLAVNKNKRKDYKGFGSYLIEIIRGIATEINEYGLGCRFIVVDADVENNPDVTTFYEKNGFVFNEQYLRNNSHNKKTVSMRLDIFEDVYEQENKNIS